MRMLPKAGRGILAYFTRHNTAANLLFVIMVGAGLIAIPQMRTQFLPDVIIETLSVTTIWEDAGAEDIDQAIVQIMQPVLIAVEGVESSESRSSEGRATITLSFEPNWDMARAMGDVQAVLDSLTTLPEESETPQVRQGRWRDRVTDVVISGPLEPTQLAQFADAFTAQLFTLGVTRTTILGVAAPEILIEVPSLHLIAHDLTMAEIARAIADEVQANPAGEIGGANARLRAGTQVRSLEQIRAIVLRSGLDGYALTIGDVAQLHQKGVDRNRGYFVGENPAISIRVERSDRGDALAIRDSVQQSAEALAETLPEGVSVTLIRERAALISERLKLLINNAAMGLFLVVILLFLFLNAHTAFWVAAGIPAALLAALALMLAAGLTLNMVSLFALIITLGIVVDDAIIVAEHADMRARQQGEHPLIAAETAAKRMALPVFSAALTSVIAFFGLTAISGRFGELIADIPFTVIVVLLASLVECFLILPNHVSHALAHNMRSHWYDVPSRKVNQGFCWFRDRLFRPALRFVLWARYPVLALAFLILASQLAMFIDGRVPWRFWNAPERGSITGNFIMAPSATRADSLAMMAEMQRATEEVGREYAQKYGRNPLEFVIATIGGNANYNLPGAQSRDADHLGGIAIDLIDADLRPYSSFAFVAALQERIQPHPLAETISFRGWRSGPGGQALDVEFFGAQSSVLKAAAEDLKQALAAFAEVSAVEDSLPYDKDELILQLTPLGQGLGFSIDDLGRILRQRLNGIEAATYPYGLRQAAIRVELPAHERGSDFLERTMIRTAQGAYVVLADIVKVSLRSGFSVIRRENGLRVVSVSGDISEDDPHRAAEIEAALQSRILPEIASLHQVGWRLSGLSEQEDTFLADALFGLLTSLGGIYLVLAWVFASWARPLVVMFIIPFGLTGVIYGHHWHDIPTSMFTVVGLLGMIGIIVNDAIVLVTTIDEYAKKDTLFSAIIEGTCDRLRPVMLTTATTVLGLTPLLFERSQQAQFLKPAVVALVYGLGFGMMLVVVVVPAVLAMQQDAGRWMRALRRGMRGWGALRLWLVPAALLATLWMGMTLLWWLMTGAPHPIVGVFVPGAQELGGAALWLVALAGVGAILAIAYFGASVALLLRRPMMGGGP
ncbi:MAG: efflux RND transporter permease subunit [Rhodobacteraceae bacterium]|nr:efflux RND transporter permease subunit [Paracoccaceae bacterium]